MDKFNILVSHPLTITSLLIWLSLEYECKPLVYLFKRPTLLSFDFQDCSIRNYSFYTFGEGAVKWQVKFKTKKGKKKEQKNVWLTVFQIKKGIYIHFIIPESLSFWEKCELSRTRVIRLNLSIEKSFKCFSSLKFHFRESAQFLSFFLATRLWQKKTIDTSSPTLGQWETPCMSLSKPRGK